MAHDYMKYKKKKLIKILERHFNKFIRLRDAGNPCISCEQRLGSEAGHYWPVSVCPQPSMRFNERNVNAQCFRCNCAAKEHPETRRRYEVGLVKKYGVGVIEELNIKRSLRQNPWTRWEYAVMIEHYKKKNKQMEADYAIQRT